MYHISIKNAFCRNIDFNVNNIRYVYKESKPSWIPFSISQHGKFFQRPPKLRNQYLDDVPLKSYLERNLPKQVLHEIEPDLIRFGNLVGKDINILGRECELNPPKLIQQNAWGIRINELWTCDAWKRMHDICAEEGLVAIGYEKKYSEWSRLYQMVKIYLYSPSSGLYSCPIAMTDGAAKTIQMSGYIANSRFQTAFNNLISRNPKQFWTSGQWMTEKKGGSDVAGGTETIAIPQKNDSYQLYGYKWFSSAADADMSITLAKIFDKNGTNQNSDALTLFYLETKGIEGNLNNLHMIRLKDKLGTRQLPTAELLLDGSIAYKLSEEGRGIATISHMLNMTRIHNAATSVSSMRRILNLASDYSNCRFAFGKKLSNYPLHVQTLARMETEVRGSLLLFLEVVKWLGKQECNKASDEEILLFRLLTPILKLYTAKQAIKVISEGLECFGGQGYMEDTGIPSALRDAQVFQIWEGTTNILSLDVLRCMAKYGSELFQAYYSNVMSKLNSNSEKLQEPKIRIENALKNVTNFVQNTSKLQVAARDLAYTLARIYIGSLLIENASNTSHDQDIITAYRWCCTQDLAPIHTNNMLKLYDDDILYNDKNMIMLE